MCRRTARDEQVGQSHQNILVLELTRNDERQAFPAGLVDEREDTELAAIMRPPLDEIVGPDMSRILRQQADA